MAIQPTRVKFPVITEVDTALLAAVNSLPLPRAAERLFNLSSRIVRDGPPEARGEEVFGELLVQHDPFEPGFAENLDAVLPFGNPAVVGSLLARFPNHSPVIALRQVWAIAAARPLMAAFLARGVLSAPVAAALPEIVPEMQRLVALALEVAPRPYYARNDEGTGPLRGSALARALVSCLKNEGGIPPLGGWTAAKSGLQLRFHWAAMAQRNREAAELLTAAMEITGVTVYLLERELTRGAAAWSRAGRPLAKLPAVKSVYLPERVQRWLQKSACLRSLVLKDAPTPYLRWSRKQQAVRLATERLVEQIQDALQSADYRRAGKLLLKVPNGAVADDVLREKLTPPPPMPAQLISHIVSAKARRSPHWLPMAPQAADTWRKRVPKVPLSEWWPCTVDEVVAGLVANRWTWRDIRVVERARLQVSWKTAHQKALLSANLFAAVTGTSRVWRSAGPRVAFSLARTATAAAVPLMREALLGMPNLRPLLEYVSESPNPESLRQDYAVLMSALQTAQGDDRGHALRFRLEAPLIGTPEWNQAPEWIREPKYFLAKMPAYLQHGGKPLNLPGFVAVFEQELSTTQWPSAEIAAALLSWAKVRPESARRLLARLSVDVLASLLKLPQLPAGMAEAAAQHLGPAGRSVSESELDVFRLRTPETLVHVAQALWRRSLLAEKLPGKAVRWRSSWAALPGDEALRDDCRLLLARQKARLVIALARDIGAERFRAAAQRLAPKLMAVSRREAALLELSAPLSPEEIGSLWVALAKCRRGAAPGHLLDHTYRRYSLPKRSGGTRIIHAPAWPVKAAQRAVLRAYLAPLGAHAAACGFVSGRSICDNAAPHVGQRVVANADVRNCFPSVSWQRVLGALRRDLQPMLSSTAVGLLLDLVTAEGALPIGAPTSPALLNRVLLRSDEMLATLARARGVRYTRYADDLTFSGESPAVQMLGHAKRVLGQVALELDPKKTHIFRRGRRQVVTGLTVNARVSVPRKLRRELRAAVDAVGRGRDPHWNGKPQSLDSLRGRLAFLAMAHPEEAARLCKKLESRP